MAPMQSVTDRSEKIEASVIIPVYNNPTGIKETIKSLENQNVETMYFEVIVVNDGSDDETSKVLKNIIHETALNIRLIEHTQSRGSYSARNSGVEIANGNFLFFTDSDCLADEHWIHRGISHLKKEGVDAAGGAINWLNETDDEITVWALLDMERNLNQEIYVKEYTFAATANLMVTESSFRQLNGFDASLNSGGDFDFCDRLSSEGFELIYLDDAKVYHPIRNSGVEFFKKLHRLIDGETKLIRRGAKNKYTQNFRVLIPRVPKVPNNYPINISTYILFIFMSNIVVYYVFLRLLSVKVINFLMNES